MQNAHIDKAKWGRAGLRWGGPVWPRAIFRGAATLHSFYHATPGGLGQGEAQLQKSDWINLINSNCSNKLGCVYLVSYTSNVILSNMIAGGEILAGIILVGRLGVKCGMANHIITYLLETKSLSLSLSLYIYIYVDNNNNNDKYLPARDNIYNVFARSGLAELFKRSML